jgi:hypothetical protein
MKIPLSLLLIHTQCFYEQLKESADKIQKTKKQQKYSLKKTTVS